MGKPKHRRCGVCHVVTSRYAHTTRQGPFVVATWVRDPDAGEVVTVNGTVIRCRAHAEVPA